MSIPGGIPGPALDAYKVWNPDSQAKALDLLRSHTESEWRPFYCERKDCAGHPHDEWGWQHARADQRPPSWYADWLVWLLKGGRGSGKTRTGSEVTHRASEKTGRVALVAATGPDLREIMVEGESGILATSATRQAPPVGAVEEETHLAQRLHRAGLLRRGTRPAPWPRARLRLVPTSPPTGRWSRTAGTTCCSGCA
jgi:hypothetical protein